MIVSTIRALGLLALLLGPACSEEAGLLDGGGDGAGDAARDLEEEGGTWPDLEPPKPDRGDPCAQARQAVEAEKAKINHCTQAGACSYMQGACPFGCYICYNQAEDPTKLKQLIAKYKADKTCIPCSYKCGPPGALACASGRCEMTHP
jgi:hypothetical protein